MEQSIAIHKPLYTAAGAVGVVGLTVGLLSGATTFALARAMTFYMLVQFIPLVSRLAWTVRVARAFRAMEPPPVRSAELRRSRVTDFVPPVAIALGLLGSGSALVCAGLAYARAASVPLLAFATIVSLWLLGRMVYVLMTAANFARPDPYMSEADLFRVRQQRFRLLFGGGAALGAYFSFMLLYTAGVIQFEFTYLTVGVSILSQLVILLATSRTLRTFDNRDFSVYREDDGTQPAGASS